MLHEKRLTRNARTKKAVGVCPKGCLSFKDENATDYSGVWCDLFIGANHTIYNFKSGHTSMLLNLSPVSLLAIR